MNKLRADLLFCIRAMLLMLLLIKRLNRVIRYWVINMLAMTVGTKEEKTIVSSNVTVSGGPPPPAPPKIGQTASGTCGNTQYSNDCNSQSSGAFNTTASEIATLAQCVAKVKTCKNGNFASFSLQNVRPHYLCAEL